VARIPEGIGEREGRGAGGKKRGGAGRKKGGGKDKHDHPRVRPSGPGFLLHVASWVLTGRKHGRHVSEGEDAGHGAFGRL